MIGNKNNKYKNKKRYKDINNNKQQEYGSLYRPENKKAIYLYLRELTGLNTKQVVSQLNKMRKKYRTFKREWDNGNIQPLTIY